MEKDNLVSIVIPNYNGEDLLRKNLPSVFTAYRNKANKILEIIIVDDGSTDQSTLLIKKEFPEVRLIKHTVNRGFSAAVNLGVRMAKGNLIALLNSDVIPSPNFLEAVFNHFSDQDVFAVSFCEEGYSWARGFLKDGFIVHEPGPISDKFHRSFWANGGSAVFRHDLWTKLGGLDEKLFSPFYWEDLDLSYRALKRGYEVIWEPGAKVVHEHESTIGNMPKRYRQRIQERNQLLFVWKNLTSAPLFRKHLVGLFSRLIKSPGYLIIVLSALKKLGLVAKERKREKKETKISDEVILTRFK